MDLSNFKWTRKAKEVSVKDGSVRIVTQAHTDLWQRTYYHFQNDNAPLFQMKSNEKYFSFTCKCEFDSKHRFDQCGVVMYLDSENWMKGSIEYENNTFQHLGSVVSNHGFSDWATSEIDASIKSIWYRLSRREQDFCLACSYDGVKFHQMRIFHMFEAKESVQFGVYACSPEDSSFQAIFTDFAYTKCLWPAHDGQQPDV